MKNILKHLEKKLSPLVNNPIQIIQIIKIIKIIQSVNNYMFIFSYFIIRIICLFPITYKFICNNYLNLKYPAFILLNIIGMCLLNIYWGFLIIKKVKRISNKSKSN